MRPPMSWSICRCQRFSMMSTVLFFFVKLERSIAVHSRLMIVSLFAVLQDSNRCILVIMCAAVGNDSRPWVVPQLIKWLSTITRERWSPMDSESGGISHLFWTSSSPQYIGSAWRARHDDINNNNVCSWDFAWVYIALNTFSLSRGAISSRPRDWERKRGWEGERGPVMVELNPPMCVWLT